MNYFDEKTASTYYEKARPFFHPVVVAKIAKYLRLSAQVKKALDVGCGTGQSTRALKEIALDVTGVDESSNMLEHAKSDKTITWLKAKAEDMPFENNSFDIITAGLAFHWFNKEGFLKECQRILVNNGWLIVYDNRFFGKALGSSDVEVWFKQQYECRYPLPKRHDDNITVGEGEKYDLLIRNKEVYVINVNFRENGFVDYLMTRSNVLAPIRMGSDTYPSAHKWIKDTVKDFFGGRTITFQFEGKIIYLEKVAK